MEHLRAGIRTPGSRAVECHACAGIDRSAQRATAAAEHLRADSADATAFKTKDRPTRTPLSLQQLLRRAEIATGPAPLVALCQTMHIKT